MSSYVTGSTSKGRTSIEEEKQRERAHSDVASIPFFKTRLSCSHLLFPQSASSRTRRLGLNTFLKAGRRVDMAEADTIRFIAENTSIPVPKLQRAWSAPDGITYIVMDFVPGGELESAWHSMSRDTKRKVVLQLKDFLAQLRALRPPADGVVASVNGGPLRDLSRMGLERFGPFETHDDFHQLLRGGVPLDKENGESVIASHRQRYSTKFTHGDFAPRNILVKRSGEITGIIDWECAGWYPEYWEYTKANFTPNAPDDWVSSIGEITGTYQQQLAGERQLYSTCGYDLTTPVIFRHRA